MEIKNLDWNDFPSNSELEMVRSGLNAYNLRFTEDYGMEPLSLTVKDSQGRLVGGLIGLTYWKWFYVDILWVDESVRSCGIGSRLLSRAEEVAVSRGCCHAHLDTHDFQAPGFYEKQGYTVCGEIRDLPPGHCRYVMSKKLSD
jgi:ribosomal protein S18 acetylase RimI-like enzyme